MRAVRQTVKEAGLDYTAIRKAHRATWKWRSGDSEWQYGPWGVSVRGIGFDVTCGCGWESRTGGALYIRVAEDHAMHLLDVVTEKAMGVTA